MNTLVHIEFFAMGGKIWAIPWEGEGGRGGEKEGAGRFEVASSCLVRPRWLGINYHIIKCMIVGGYNVG